MLDLLLLLIYHENTGNINRTHTSREKQKKTDLFFFCFLLLHGGSKKKTDKKQICFFQFFSVFCVPDLLPVHLDSHVRHTLLHSVVSSLCRYDSINIKTQTQSFLLKPPDAHINPSLATRSQWPRKRLRRSSRCR